MSIAQGCGMYLHGKGHFACIGKIVSETLLSIGNWDWMMLHTIVVHDLIVSWPWLKVIFQKSGRCDLHICCVFTAFLDSDKISHICRCIWPCTRVISVKSICVTFIQGNPYSTRGWFGGYLNIVAADKFCYLLAICCPTHKDTSSTLHIRINNKHVYLSFQDKYPHSNTLIFCALWFFCWRLQHPKWEQKQLPRGKC